MKEDSKTTAKEVIRVVLLILAGIAIALTITLIVLVATKNIPGIYITASSDDKEIESVLILDGEKSIMLSSVEVNGKMYRPTVESSGLYVTVNYYTVSSGTEEIVWRHTVKTAPENIVIRYVKEEVKEK